MDPNTALLLALGVLFLTLAVRVPVAFCLLAAGVTGVFALDGASSAANTLARLPYQTPARYVLIIIPFFIAMGIFAKNGTLALDAFNLAKRLTRRVPGGLAVATVAACAGFAAVSGSSVAMIAALGPAAIREMRRHGYHPTLAAGVVGASGTLGILIPPSIALVLYGIVTNVAIGPLLVAGIIPGILTACVFAFAIILIGMFRPGLVGSGSDKQSTSSNKMSRVGAVAAESEDLFNPDRLRWSAVGRIVFLFGVVMGGIYTGSFTATEAGAIGAMMALAMMIYDSFRTGGIRQFRADAASSVMESVSTTSMTFMLLIGSAVFSYFLVSSGIPAAFTDWVLQQPVPPLMVVALLLLAFIPLGMFLDPISMLLIGVPLAYPVISALGFDGIWFGILIVKTMEIGLLTPPFGLNAFVVAGTSEDISVERAFAGVLWFVPLDVIVILLIFFIPEIATWLPAQMAR